MHSSRRQSEVGLVGQGILWNLAKCGINEAEMKLGLEDDHTLIMIDNTTMNTQYPKSA